MPVSPVGAEDHQPVSLPRSHYFISLSRGPSMRTVRVRTGVLRGGLAAGTLLLLWSVAATAYLGFHDDLIAAVMAREARMQYAYEERIAALRGQVEHEASVSLVGQSTLDGRVRELTLRAKTLEARASLVEQAGERVGMTAAPATARMPIVQPWRTGATQGGIDNPVETGSIAAPASAVPRPLSTLPGAIPKPRPEADNGQPMVDPVARRDGPPSIRLQLADIAEALERIDAAQYDRIAAIGQGARRTSETIRLALSEAGLSPQRVLTKRTIDPVGGPFVPLGSDIVHSPFGHALDALQASVVDAEGLTRALPSLPFAKPLLGPMEVTSPFGARLDPFLGRPAMHTGVDLRDESGTDVEATAAGRVVSAGPAGGYGTMIELDHGHGLSTRYAHLSAVDVHEGQMVAKGEVIGEVGSTGRATGPHLHYETRIDGEAVDPTRFLSAGERLAGL